MTKVTSFAGLALLLALVLTGCTEVRKCTKGEAGCVDGVPDSDGKCAAGLERKNGKCVEPEGSNGGGSCNCAIDELCAPDGTTCLAYCAPVDELPQAGATPGPCKAVKTASNSNPPELTFEELCVNTCMQTCVRAQTFCPGFVCDPDDCKGAVARLRCNMDCPGMDKSCMESRCTEQSKVACTDFRCPGTETRNCVGIRCTDSCSGNNKDGFCDDGDPASATYSFCTYGSDCTDCGPRRGIRPPGLALGEPCPEGQDVSCEGYNDDFLMTEAWCLRYLPDSGAPFRCVPDCTTADGAGECDDGYECQAVKNAAGEPYRDATEARTAGYACVPQVCE